MVVLHTWRRRRDRSNKRDACAKGACLTTFPLPMSLVLSFLSTTTISDYEDDSMMQNGSDNQPTKTRDPLDSEEEEEDGQPPRRSQYEDDEDENGEVEEEGAVEPKRRSKCARSVVCLSQSHSPLMSKTIDNEYSARPPGPSAGFSPWNDLCQTPLARVASRFEGALMTAVRSPWLSYMRNLRENPTSLC